MEEVECVVTLATVECLAELRLFLSSLRHHHVDIPVMIGASSQLMAAWKQQADTPRDDRLLWVPCLDQYGDIDRQAMEAHPGVWFPSRHCDFMMEKAAVMQLALERGLGSSVLYVDCDVVTLAPLPRIPADRTTVFGVSPHGIDPADEARWGRYNGGFVWTRDQRLLFEWRRFTHRSRFHDQASLEDVAQLCRGGQCGGARVAAVHEFGAEVNYGYWRLTQRAGRSASSLRDDSVWTEAQRFRSELGQPIRYADPTTKKDVPLQSVHTHFFLQQTPPAMAVFNSFIKRLVRRAGPNVIGRVPYAKLLH
jgi:hypothetical protein